MMKWKYKESKVEYSGSVYGGTPVVYNGIAHMIDDLSPGDVFTWNLNDNLPKVLLPREKRTAKVTVTVTTDWSDDELTKAVKSSIGSDVKVTVATLKEKKK